MAVDQRGGKVYVADSANARVQKFNKKGKFKAVWGWGVKDGQEQSEVCKTKTDCQAGIAGAGAGQFSIPTSVAVDSSKGPSKGNVYVGDAGNNVVQKFTSGGKYLSTIDGSTTPQGHFVSLAGVAVDQNGTLWIADAGTGNVAQFNAAGTFLGEWNDPSGSPRAIAVDATHGAVYLINGNGDDRALHVHRRGPDDDRPQRLGHGAGARSADREPVRRSRQQRRGLRPARAP